MSAEQRAVQDAASRYEALVERWEPTLVDLQASLNMYIFSASSSSDMGGLRNYSAHPCVKPLSQLHQIAAGLVNLAASLAAVGGCVDPRITSDTRHVPLLDHSADTEECAKSTGDSSHTHGDPSSSLVPGQVLLGICSSRHSECVYRGSVVCEPPGDTSYVELLLQSTTRAVGTAADAACEEMLAKRALVTSLCTLHGLAPPLTPANDPRDANLKPKSKETGGVPRTEGGLSALDTMRSMRAPHLQYSSAGGWLHSAVTNAGVAMVGMSPVMGGEWIARHRECIAGNAVLAQRCT
eukprot:TRINITY_DN21689_c0_g1_i1.p1 TRINITY_DN21689_c0_g1~~TRINITY_DN21689_c0_g1_i1.p1  ORF type:complete len:295 (+),score=4.95 TRINITY_DN21689_c0_g1_i1:121-1005(+)